MEAVKQHLSLVLEAAKPHWEAYDAQVNDIVFQVAEVVGFDELKSPSPLTRDLPFIANPTHVVTFILAYLLLVGLGVAFLKAFPKKEGSKDGPLMRCLVQLHNVFLVGLSLYMCVTVCYEAYKNKYKFWGQAYDPSEKGMGWVIYVFFASKLYEFLDTIIMILKGNLKQVSFLHVYHHASVSIIWWTIAYSAPGGDAWFSAAFNSLVHVIMYTYYCATSIIKKIETRKKYLWWARYLTQFQMFQFCCMACQSANATLFNNSDYSPFLSKLLFWYMMTLLTLFANFFIRKYLVGKTKAD